MLPTSARSARSPQRPTSDYWPGVTKLVVRGGVEPPTFRFSGVLSPRNHDLLTATLALLSRVYAGQHAYATMIATVPPCAA